jgi:hypothetical protein
MATAKLNSPISPEHWAYHHNSSSQKTILHPANHYTPPQYPGDDLALRISIASRKEKLYSSEISLKTWHFGCVKDSLLQTLCPTNVNYPQADITDPYRHFESEVPARALKEPVLRFAIFAFSSRHLNRQNDSNTAEALQYHNECVQLLIPALSEPEHITEDFLTAVAILRQHEEMDGRFFSVHTLDST